MAGELMYELSAVTRDFGPLRALDQIDLTITEGLHLGLVGGSGSGKTTLVRLLAGLDRPTSGELWFTDAAGVRHDLTRRSKPLRGEVQYVFQDPRSSLDPLMTIADTVAEPLRVLRMPARERASRVAEVLDAVGLPSTAGARHPHEFSGGQRQRIAIARALAPGPRVLIADEPVSALDVSVRNQVLNLLHELVEATEHQLTLITVSHDLAVVELLSHQVAVLHEGVLVDHGSTAAVLADPSPTTRALFDARLRLD